MTHSVTTTPLFALITVMGLAACAGPDVFDRIDAAESADVAATPYPKLADVASPGAGPDLATGDAVLIELGAEAAEAEARLEAVKKPVQ